MSYQSEQVLKEVFFTAGFSTGQSKKSYAYSGGVFTDLGQYPAAYSTGNLFDAGGCRIDDNHIAIFGGKTDKKDFYIVEISTATWTRMTGYNGHLFFTSVGTTKGQGIIRVAVVLVFFQSC